MSNNTIIYVGPYSFPEGGAAARRILGNCLTLHSLGYNVVISSGQMNSSSQKDQYMGFPVVSLNERCYEHYPSLIKHLMYLGMGRKTIDWLDGLEEKPLAVILYSGYSPYLIRLKKWCSQNGVKLIFDAVEWYEGPSSLVRLFSPYHLNISLAMNILSPKAKNIICISHFLHQYYSSKGCNTVIIPPTLDHSKVYPNLVCSRTNVLKLAYTGVPGKKDLLDIVFQSVIELNDEGVGVELHLAGDCSQLIEKYASYLDKFIFDHGFLSHEETLDLVKGVDFTVLFRPEQRSSHAGFSTKFVESLSVGTPVIGNHTSDLDLHLKDSETGVVCNRMDVEHVKKKIKYAASLNQDMLVNMRKKCRKHSEMYFDYLVYRDDLKGFIEALH